MRYDNLVRPACEATDRKAIRSALEPPSTSVLVTVNNIKSLLYTSSQVTLACARITSFFSARASYGFGTQFSGTSYLAS